MTEITINIDTQPIAQAAVDEAVRQAFVASKYRGEDCGAGFEEVKAQVRRHIAALDLGDVIAESIARQLPGVPAHAACFFKDGDAWCCVRGDFINLQESPAGFGDNMEEALNALSAAVGAA